MSSELDTQNCKIYTGWIDHVRCGPVVHKFRYPMYTYGLDLDQLEDLDRKIPFFSYNKFNFLSLCDSDYLPGFEGSLKNRVKQVLQAQGIEQEFSRIELVTNVKVFNYIFNPVNFYRCFDSNNRLAVAIAEVNNTFGETHLYVLNKPEERKNSYIKYRSRKEFHVSPFNDRKGDYLFYLLESDSRLDVRVNIEKKDKVVFTTQLRGEAKTLDSASLLRTILRFPISAVLSSPRIMIQAGKLWALRRLPVFTKPIADSPMTIRRTPAGLLQKTCLSICSSFLSRIEHGHIVIECPDSKPLVFGDLSEQPGAKIKVHNYDFFVRSMLFGDIGFGESYVDEQWETDDLVRLLGVFALNQKQLDDRKIWLSHFGRVLNYIRHLFHSNSLSGSKKNIRAHYDLSNELFSLFLDPSMTYSAAQFSVRQQDLADAQRNKISTLIEKAQISTHDHVLEIGCGWGSFAIQAAKEIGCRVTGITLSREQRDYALKRIAAEGLDSLIDIKLCDYRSLSGQYDKIVSIEMIEAVGHEFLGEFFSQCDRLLRPDGILVLQAITFPDNRYDVYRKGCDWVQKYIFPGGVCPSITALASAMSRNSDFVIESIDNIGLHYAETLRRWRQRFDRNEQEILALGFDERFMRMWRYYLMYCEAGFETRTLGTHHLVLTRVASSRLGKINDQ